MDYKEAAHELAEKVRKLDSSRCRESYQRLNIKCTDYGKCRDCYDALFTTIANRIEALEAPKHDPDIEAFLNRLNEAAVAEQPVELWGREYLPVTKAMELPVDADGVPVSVGDEMCFPGEEWHYIVGELCLREGARWVAFLECKGEVEPGKIVHYKPRTIEDVLRDAEDTDGRDGESWAALINEAYEIGMREAVR